MGQNLLVTFTKVWLRSLYYLSKFLPFEVSIEACHNDMLLVFICSCTTELKQVWKELSLIYCNHLQKAREPSWYGKSTQHVSPPQTFRVCVTPVIQHVTSCAQVLGAESGRSLNFYDHSKYYKIKQPVVKQVESWQPSHLAFLVFLWPLTLQLGQSCNCITCLQTEVSFQLSISRAPKPCTTVWIISTKNSLPWASFWPLWQVEDTDTCQWLDKIHMSRLASVFKQRSKVEVW